MDNMKIYRKKDSVKQERKVFDILYLVTIEIHGKA